MQRTNCFRNASLVSKSLQKSMKSLTECNGKVGNNSNERFLEGFAEKFLSLRMANTISNFRFIDTWILCIEETVRKIKQNYEKKIQLFRGNWKQLKLTWNACFRRFSFPHLNLLRSYPQIIFFSVSCYL